MKEPRRKLFRSTVSLGGLKLSLSHFVIVFETKVFESECLKKEAAEWERLNFIQGVNEPRRKLFRLTVSLGGLKFSLSHFVIALRQRSL